MAFNIVDILKEGKTEYIDKVLTRIDLNSASNLIRKSPFKVLIIKMCESDFDNHPYFWMDIIYDVDEFFWKSIHMREIYNYPFTTKQYENILYNSKYGEEYIYYHFWEILHLDINFINILFDYVIEKSIKKEFWFDFLLKNEDLHIRTLIMIIIIQQYPQLLSYYGSDITLYFTNSVERVNSQTSLFLEKMNAQDVSLIAYNLFISGYLELFRQAKEFLFQNYEQNYLAYYLFEGCNIPFKNRQKEEIDNDLERYFLTDAKMQFAIYRNYTDSLKQQVLDDFRKQLRILSQLDDNCLNRFQKIYFYELGKKLEFYIEKYLDLSRSKKIEKIGEGSTCYSLRLGDYLLKLCDTKWSYEDVICPGLFLIVKNMEQDYVRDNMGIILCGLEVQPYLKRSIDSVPEKYLDCFSDTLKQLGYFLNDRMISSEWGDNVKLLDSYEDANTDDIDALPQWFKDYPIVLVDRDRVYPIDRIEETSKGRRLNIKQRRDVGAN